MEENGLDGFSELVSSVNNPNLNKVPVALKTEIEQIAFKVLTRLGYRPEEAHKLLSTEGELSDPGSLSLILHFGGYPVLRNQVNRAAYVASQACSSSQME